MSGHLLYGEVEEMVADHLSSRPNTCVNYLSNTPKKLVRCYSYKKDSDNSVKIAHIIVAELSKISNSSSFIQG